MSMEEAEAAQVVEDNGSGGKGGGGGGGGVELWYEDIEAPKFVDFTAADHYNPDDRYWFCARVGCDQRHEQEINLDEINKNFILRVMAARSPNLKLRRALTTANSSTTTTRKCPLTAPSKSSRPRISRLELLSSISRKLVDGKDRPLPSAKPITTVTPKQPTTKKPTAIIGNALTTPKRAVKPQLFRSARNPRKLEQSAVVSSKEEEEQNNRMVAKALLFTSPKKKKKVLADTSITKDDASVRKMCKGMKKLDINGGQRLLPPQSNTSAASSRKKMGAREVKSRVYDALKPRNCKKGKENNDSLSRRIRHVREEESHVSISLVVCHGSSSSSGEESSDMEVDENSNRGSSSIDKCSVESSELFEVAIIQDCLDDLRTKLPIQVEQLPPSSDDVGNHHCEEEDGGAEEKVKSEDREKSPKEEQTRDEEDILESDDKENVSALDLNSRVQNTESGRNIMGKSQKGRVNSKEATTAEVKSGSNYSKPRPTNPKPFRLRTDERRVLKEANLEKKLLLLTPLKETKSGAVISSGSSLQKKKVVSSLKAQERVRRRRSIQQQRGVMPTEKRQLSVIKEKAVIKETSAPPPPNLKKKKKGSEEENTNKPSSATSDSCSRSVSRGRIRPTMPREPHFHKKTCCTKKWV